MDIQDKGFIEATNRIVDALQGDQKKIESVEQKIALGVVDPRSLVEFIDEVNSAYKSSVGATLIAFLKNGKKAKRFLDAVNALDLNDSLFDLLQYVFLAAFNEAYDRYAIKK